MALTHSAARRSAMATAHALSVDAGTTNPNGRLIFMTAGDVEVATLNLSNPAFLSESSGSITADTITSDSSATGGTIALFKVTDRDNNEIYRGTASDTGTPDMDVTNTVIIAGQSVTCSSLVYNASV